MNATRFTTENPQNRSKILEESACINAVRDCSLAYNTASQNLYLSLMLETIT